MANGAGIEKIYLIAAVTLILAAGVVPARAADLAGRVFDQSGAGVANVQVSVNNHDGKQIAVATSNATGDYSIHDIAPGTYSFHARGQSAVAYLGDDGLTINWGLVPNLPPIASARPGVATDDGEDRALGAQN